MSANLCPVCEQGDEITTCGNCYGVWCDGCDPAHGPLCPWCHGAGYSTAAIELPTYRQANHTFPVLSCKHCDRPISTDREGRWIDPEATGDDSIWRETCDSHDTFTAEHEPAL